MGEDVTREDGTPATSTPGGALRRVAEREVGRRGLLGIAGASSALAWLTGCSSDDVVSGMPGAILHHRVVGDPQPDGFTVSTRTPRAVGVRLRVGRERNLVGEVTLSPVVAPDEDGWAHTRVTGLDADSRYFYDLEVSDGERFIPYDRPRPARTLPRPGLPASFDFAFGSCMRTGADNPTVMERISDRDPLMFLHLGDFGYFDNASTSAASHRKDFQRQLKANEGLASVLSGTPTYYIQSDHDAGGGNNAGRGPWTPANRQAYRQVFPHPDLGDHEEGLYWSVVVGRVRLVFTDHKTFPSPAKRADTAAKTMMGTDQKQWFKTELRKDEPVKIWVQHSTFIDDTAEDDKWGNYATEQEELATFIRREAVGEVVTVHGDMHAVAVSTENPWGLRSWCGAPFDARSSHKGGPWTEGPVPEPDQNSTRQYGYVEVTDTDDRIELAFTGYDLKDRPLVSDRFGVTTGD